MTSALEKLLQPLPGDEPAGPDLEYDPDYLAAFRAAAGTPGREMGDTLVPGEEPDWRRVRDLARDLLSRSKDLRLAVLFTRARLRVDGLSGLGDGLTLILGLIEKFWDQVHPRLDPEDGNDPTQRVNVLLELCAQEHLLDALRTTPLVRSRVFGTLSFRDIEIAEGRTSAPTDAKPLDAAAIRGTFQDCDIDELKETSSAASTALNLVQTLDAALQAHLDPDQMPNLDPLTGLLSAISSALLGHLAERMPQDDAPAQTISAETSTRPDSNGNVQTGAMPGQIGSREDVVHAIDRICDYYSRNEPSSPVPLLLRRARRLATGNFVEIMRDLAPSALADIEKVCGLDKED